MLNEQSRNTVIAIVLSGIILFSWQYFYGPKNQTPVDSAVKQEIATVAVTASVAPVPLANKDLAVSDQSINLKNGKLTFDFSNTLIWKNISAVGARNSLTQISNSITPFSISIIDQNNNIFPITLAVTKNSENSFEGVDSKFGITAKIFLKDDGKANLLFSSETPYRYRFNFTSLIKLSSEQEKVVRGSTNEFVYFTGSDVKRTSVGSSDNFDASTKWFGLDSFHHLFAIVFREQKNSLISISTLKNSDGGESNTSRMVVDIVKPEQVVAFDLVYALKDYDKLKALGEKLDLSVNFGLWGIIAAPMLNALKYTYKYVQNYGVAIIILTIILRIVIFPLNFKSIKSMKRMSKIQPEMQKIREKYKDDSQRMQMETMSLFKREKVNPLSGCWPMLLQLPIFIAFYNVLSQSVELVDAPFMFWLNDLSSRDKWFVLPVLVTITMFIQQKMTPQPNMDKTQQKIMTFMPLMFGVFMWNMQAGLNLYMFVSTLIGIGQQVLVYKLIKD